MGGRQGKRRLTWTGEKMAHPTGSWRMCVAEPTCQLHAKICTLIRRMEGNGAPESWDNNHLS